MWNYTYGELNESKEQLQEKKSEKTAQVMLLNETR